MDALSVAAFEERAATAEARLSALESLLSSGAGPADSAALTELRALLVAAKEESEKEAVQRKSLEDEVAKLRYQVLHLKRAVRELEAQHTPATR
ncbi:hypothetical protein CHLRE_11g482600v5 [Chlamydomonas reinhardtii]|uniref:Uncharacterized protein n=1 Tax=Chlamydomonas reinhardtii TaxID=3055 RepID=A0A2K3D8U2_CHLRE|nr:uncharacterized protein CHLRE_11g482600v5 [Chlamydomonas reinhardtii]PNW76954.1 hypothetical protein CHLRE_11g482600v5 [Chlamydomonas reinhardtii]